MIAKELQEIIASAAATTPDKIALEHPELEDHGDYSTNIALVLKGGRKMAEEIASKIKGEMIERVEVAGPGFINIWLKQDYLLKQLDTATNLQHTLKGKKTMIEFTDPNPFKEFHIGHLYSNIVGEAISKLLEAQGAEVWRVCYQGDVGLHVAKSIWGMRSLISQMPEDSASLAEKAAFLGKAYAQGATKYEEDEAIKTEINALNKQIYDQDSSVVEEYAKGKRWSLEYFESIYKKLGTVFKKYYFESEVGKIGLKLVRDNVKNGVFTESQGAVVFEGERFGLHTRVFINSLGLPTYEAKELGLAPTKYHDFAYDESLIITGNEIDDYFKVLLAALKELNPELAAKTRHLSHGMVRLPSGKMSSRTGKVITGEWLMDEAKKHALNLNSDTEVAESVSLAAIKYALLRSGIGKDIEFDFDESVSFDGNSGPYLQYTYARTQSVLRKVEAFSEVESSLALDHEELRILRYIYRYTEVVHQAADRFSPNLIANFLYELAQRYNAFYNKDTIMGNEFRVKLTRTVAEILKSGLSLLGIDALSQM